MTTKKTNLVTAAGQPYLLTWTISGHVDVTTTFQRGGKPASVGGATPAGASTPGKVTIAVTRDGKTVDFDGADPVAKAQGGKWVFTAKVAQAIAGVNVYSLQSDVAGSDAFEETVEVLSLSPFPAAAYPALDLDKTDAPLQRALEAAIAAAKDKLGGDGQTVAFSIFCLATNGKHRYAGVHDETMHYSASMLKVAAMYSAHELLAAATRLARTPGGHRASADTFYAALESVYDAQIAAVALPDVLDAAKKMADLFKGKYRATPTYRQIFTIAGTGGAGAPTVDFSPDFLARMTNMIEWSDDPDSGECIRRLSYSYINGALMKAGFCTATKNAKSGFDVNGVWLAGDYSKGSGDHPYALVTSENDKLVAQATTTRKMLQVFALITLKQLMPQDGINDRMRTLLAKAASHGGFCFQAGHPPRPFTLTLSKIGVGPLKTGDSVSSEGQVLQWTPPPDPASKGLTGEFVVCWQNLRADVEGVMRVYGRAYAALLA